MGGMWKQQIAVYFLCTWKQQRKGSQFGCLFFILYSKSGTQSDKGSPSISIKFYLSRNKIFPNFCYFNIFLYSLVIAFKCLVIVVGDVSWCHCKCPVDEI